MTARPMEPSVSRSSEVTPRRLFQTLEDAEAPLAILDGGPLDPQPFAVAQALAATPKTRRRAKAPA